MILVSGVVLALLLGGCAARSHTKLAGGGIAPSNPHGEPVCLVRAPLPSSIEYTVIGEVKGGKRFYGSFSEVLAVMADEARRVGADAVIALKTETDVNAIAWARPVGNGKAIKLKDKSSFDCKQNGGTLY
jgi:hypothetical protein